MRFISICDDLVYFSRYTCVMSLFAKYYRLSFSSWVYFTGNVRHIYAVYSGFCVSSDCGHADVTFLMSELSRLNETLSFIMCARCKQCSAMYDMSSQPWLNSVVVPDVWYPRQVLYSLEFTLVICDIVSFTVKIGKKMCSFIISFCNTDYTRSLHSTSYIVSLLWYYWPCTFRGSVRQLVIYF